VEYTFYGLLALGALNSSKDSTAIQLSMKRYLRNQGVDITSAGVVGSILGYYGKDYTFSLPILSMLVLCNVLDGQALKKIPQLPFELTLLPTSIYRFFNLKVVSYAIPALVGAGIYLFKHNQYRLPHRFNKYRPGGWGWTSFTGSVPDADDTAGAVLALLTLDPETDNVKTSILNGSKWLGALQNRDGGIPTFCRGWGRLPFDASCADLTGHTVLARVKVIESLSVTTASNHDHSEIRRLKKYINRALRFLEKEQRTDGAWLPLWFGHQQTADKTNPVYGSARVMSYLDDALACGRLDHRVSRQMEQMIVKAQHFLVAQQNDDGSWGAIKRVEGSMEETAMAVSALVRHEPSKCLQGLNWLDCQYDVHGLTPQPIGLYFATLWYHEKMYPLAYYLEALRRTIGWSILPAKPKEKTHFKIL